MLDQTLEKRPPELPLLNLNHLRRLTDDTGLIQHACFTVPNYGEGYATDDNARALIVAVSLEEQGEDASGASDRHGLSLSCLSASCLRSVERDVSAISVL